MSIRAVHQDLWKGIITHQPVTKGTAKALADLLHAEVKPTTSLEAWRKVDIEGWGGSKWGALRSTDLVISWERLYILQYCDVTMACASPLTVNTKKHPKMPKGGETKEMRRTHTKKQKDHKRAFFPDRAQ